MSFLKTDNLKIAEQNVVRIYLTSARSLKKESIQNCSMNDTLKDTILRLSFSKFVWCVDLASTDEYKNQKTAQRIIIDSTGAESDSEPWIMFHDSEKIVYFDEGQWHKIKVNINAYQIYRHNLKEVYE